MSETSTSESPRDPLHGALAAGHPWFRAPSTDAQGHPLHDADDPVTEWLLEQPELDGAEFAVLFAIHTLNARHPRSAWIRRTELCRSSGLNQVGLTRVLNGLRYMGFVGMLRNPVDSSRARYLLVVRQGAAGSG